MRIMEILSTASRALRSNRLRTILSVLGIVIGVASVITLIAVGTGAQQQVTENISALGTNIINISPGFGVGRAGRQSSSGEEIFTLELGETIEKVAPSVKRVVPIQQASGFLVRGDENLRVTVMGVTPAYAAVMNYKVASGRFLRQADVDGEAFVAIIGANVATDLFPGVNPVGEGVYLSMRGRRVPVLLAGVMEERRPVGFLNYAGNIYIPSTSRLRRIQGTRSVANDTAEACWGNDVDSAIAEITYLLACRTGCCTGFCVSRQLALLESFTDSFGSFTVLLAAIEGIPLVGDGIGIRIIMMVA